MSPTPRYHSLRLQDLVLWVHLGCTAEERANAQEVRVTVEFRLTEAPAGLVSDRLDETLCYAEVATAVRRLPVNREYSLIERLAAEIHSAVRPFAEKNVAEVAVAVHKVAPPIDGLLGGAVYRCGDFPA